jgi:hypothetical protein
MPACSENLPEICQKIQEDKKREPGKNRNPFWYCDGAEGGI